tara:strand:+ start:7954 stop:10236 length:2283 start_codon:yes stop_codon:yes gene_type:complete
VRLLEIGLIAFLFAFPAVVLWQDTPIPLERSPANFASNSCKELIENISDINLSGSKKVIRGAFGFDDVAVSEGKHLQFGFESEYTLSEIDKIVTIYGPKPGHGMSKSRWFSLPVKERADWVRANIKELFPEPRKPGGLIKLKDQATLKFLPDALIQDDTGNLEFVLEPFDSYEDWYRAIKKLNSRFGEGSMQATISAPPESFFGDAAGVAQAQSVKEKIGLFNFYSEYDILQKLNAGHLRYQQDPERLVARNFEHPFLGPMTSAKQRQLNSMLRANAKGEKLDDVSLEAISGLESSFKYTGGTVYRPDILGADRVVLEVRDAHKNFTLLSDRLLRSLFFMQHGTAGFDELANLKSFHLDNDFLKLPKNVRDELKRIFPNKANAQYEYTASEKKALDVYKNFAYPLRDWGEHLEAIKATSIADQVEQAQNAYKAKLSDIVARMKSGDLDDEHAKAEIQGALAEFANKSKIAKAFEDYEENVIFAAERGAQSESLVKEISLNSGPLKEAFPAKIWSGPINERMAQLQSKYPNNLKKVDQIKFKFNNQPGGRRDVYIVSFKGMSESQKKAFFDDYFAATSENTVSFPMSSGGGHLYTRVGDKSYNFFFSSDVDFDAYPMPSSDRLETFIELESDEFLRLRKYVDNGVNDGDKLLGDSGYQGVTGDTRNTLSNNRPTSASESHNCTSWLCTAPIGDGGEAIHDLAGAPRSHNIHTNPGWWTSWLANYAPRERIPFVFYFTNDSMESATQKVSGGQTFNWDFDTH